MSARLPPKQWDIWFASLRHGMRGEQMLDHHVLAVSSARIQRASSVVVVAPITSTLTARWLFQWKGLMSSSL